MRSASTLTVRNWKKVNWWLSKMERPSQHSLTDSGTQSWSRRGLWMALAAIVTLTLFGYSQLPWEWSDIDDPGLVLGLQREVADHGVLGYVTNSYRMFQTDLAWGLFRPSYWIYPSLVYGFPVGVAQALRLLLLTVAIVGPIIALRRQGASRSTAVMGVVLMVIPATYLMWGLFFVSLQELSGAALIGLGLIARSQLRRTLWWTLAAWFKSPFAWILIGQAVVLWHQGKRRDAGVAASLGLGTLLVSYLFARQGSYTAGYTLSIGSLIRAWENTPKLLELPIALTFVALFWWLMTTGGRLRLNNLAITLGIAWLGYTLHLLPWGVTGNYAGGINYLFSVFVVSLLEPPNTLERSRIWLSLTIPLLIASVSLFWSVRDLYERNQTARGITDCIVLTGSSSVFLSERWGLEAETRFHQNLIISNPEWAGKVTLLENIQTVTPVRGQVFVFTRDDQGLLTPPLTPICDLPRAIIAQVR